MKENSLLRLLLLIEEQLGWGVSADWRSKDFEQLNILIQEKTKVSLSASTLRRIWGKVGYTNQPSITTLDTLAQFAEYENWRSFCFLEKETSSNGSSNVVQAKKFPFRLVYIIGIAFIVMIMITISIFSIRLNTGGGGTDKYAFSFRPVTHGLPNSVLFTYDAHNAVSDSIFIQQSWDNARRTRVSKNTHLFSSIYYKPGFYHAKLVAGNLVVEEKPLLIPTTGWLGMIDLQPVPIYLNQGEFIKKGEMSITTSTVLGHKVPLEPQPPVVAFYNVGNFKPLSILNFSYTAEVKNTYNFGSSRCQQVNIILFTSGIPISIPLSEPRCVASLSMLDGVGEIDGSSADLSPFGSNLSKWVRLHFISRNGQISILLNDKLAFRYKTADRKLDILGVGFRFQGTGQVRHVALTSNKKNIFSDF
jgi:hypothetical protein